MRLPVRFVCAFSDVPRRGNPAAVVLLDDLLEEASMQTIAAELAQPITTFVAGARSPYQIRWYTPAVEEVLCGHGTVAAVHALTETDRGRERVLRFEYRAGALTAHVTDRGYALELPASAVVTYRDDGAVAQALGCRPEEITPPPTRSSAGWRARLWWRALFLISQLWHACRSRAWW